MSIFPSRFDLAWRWIQIAEGRFADEKGNPTMIGISARFLKDLGDRDGNGRLDGDLDGDGDIDTDDIKLITPARAMVLYTQYFWLDFGCCDLPDVVGLCLFDAAVHHRPRTARMLVQSALGVAADGVIGPKTAERARMTRPGSFLDSYQRQRSALLRDIAMQPSKVQYGAGWQNRLRWLRDFIAAHYYLGDPA